MRSAAPLACAIGPDVGAVTLSRYAAPRRIGPLFLDSSTVHGVTGTASFLRAVVGVRTFCGGSWPAA